MDKYNNSSNNSLNNSNINNENKLNIPKILETKEEVTTNNSNNNDKFEETNNPFFTTTADSLPFNSEEDPNSDNNNLNINLINILSPVVSDLDERISNVQLSQTQLNLILNQLLKNLKDFETSITPPLIQPSIDKLIKAKSRLNSINHTLLVVMDRLDKMQSVMGGQQGK